MNMYVDHSSRNGCERTRFHLTSSVKIICCGVQKQHKMRKNLTCRYDDAVSWCHRIIQSRDDVLFDPSAFYAGVSNAAQKFGYAFEVSS